MRRSDTKHEAKEGIDCRAWSSRCEHARRRSADYDCYHLSPGTRLTLSRLEHCREIHVQCMYAPDKIEEESGRPK